MTGETDYNTVFSNSFDRTTGMTDDYPWTKVYYEDTTYLMLLAFIFFMCIILMNLFVGLIVGDVDAINRIAETKKWKMNIDFIEYTGWNTLLNWDNRLHL